MDAPGLPKKPPAFAPGQETTFVSIDASNADTGMSGGRSPLTHAERRKLIEAPFIITRFTCSYRHAGTLIPFVPDSSATWVQWGRSKADESGYRELVERGETLPGYALDEVSALWGD